MTGLGEGTVASNTRGVSEPDIDRGRRDALSAGDDTIFAQATGPGQGGIAIIRISGPRAGPLLDAMTSPRPAPRHATLRTLRDRVGDILDRALVLWFPGPNSYTGEDCAELHLHAGLAVIEGVSMTLRQAGARAAGPGEFTQRAFLSGRIDLIQAEGIADLIEAETQTQRRQALAQSGGALSDLYRTWSAALRRLVALQEAAIDFPDDADDATISRVDDDMSALEILLVDHLADGERGASLRRGLTIAITGRPNVGKSSLMNALSARDVSIVSNRPGTTRDVVEARIVLGGCPVTLLDTAGIRDSDDPVEQEGVRRALQSSADADIALRVTCGNDAATHPHSHQTTIDVSNKIDLHAERPGTIGVSVLTGEGLAELQRVLSATVEHLTRGTSLPPMTRARHRDCVERALDHLRSARKINQAELRGEELRLSLHELGRLTGAVSVEDILSDIFSTFCIGK